MSMYSQVRLGIVGLVIAIALLVGISANTPLAEAQTKKTVQVAIGLDTNSASEDQIARMIRQDLRSRRIAFKEQDVRTASRNAVDLIAKEKDPLKGVIYVKFKKFTICISWGADKNFCKSH